jgi:hypothetical protein
MVTDALRARRHGKPSGHGERCHVGEPCHGLPARVARARDCRPGGRGGERVRGGGGCRGKAHFVCPGAQRRLPRLAFRPVARPRPRARLRQLPDPHARHVRELRRRAPGRTGAPCQGNRAGDRGGERGTAARAAADLPGRVRVPGVCAPGRAAQLGPLHARGGRSAHRRSVPVHRLAVPALALWPAVHARLLSARAARTGGRPLGAEGCRGDVQPRRGRPHGKRGEQDGPLSKGGGGVRGLEPGAAGARGGRRPQRHARAAGAGGRPRARGRCRGSEWGS